VIDYGRGKRASLKMIEFWFRKLYRRIIQENDGRFLVNPDRIYTNAFPLHGLAVEDLKNKELDAIDRSYEILIAVRAVKPEYAN
jgi:hypothetical protein